MLENTLESPLDCKEIESAHPKEISTEYSLEGLMLKLKFQYFGHLMWRTDSLGEKITLILGNTEGRRRRWQRMRWLDGHDWLNGHRLNGHEFDSTPGIGDGQGSLMCCSPWCHRAGQLSDWTELCASQQPWKILKEMRIPDHLSCFMRNIYVGQEATVRPYSKQMTASILEKEYNRFRYFNPDYLTYIQNCCCCCSVAKLCSTLCDPMYCNTLDFPVPCYLPEFDQVHVHWINVANHFILYCPLLFLPSIFPSIGVFPNEFVLCITWPKYWISGSTSVLPKSIQGWFPLRLTGLISMLSKGLSRVFSSNTVWKHQFFGSLPSYCPALTSIHDYWKDHNVDYIDLC